MATQGFGATPLGETVRRSGPRAICLLGSGLVWALVSKVFEHSALGWISDQLGEEVGMRPGEIIAWLVRHPLLVLMLLAVTYCVLTVRSAQLLKTDYHKHNELWIPIVRGRAEPSRWKRYGVPSLSALLAVSLLTVVVFLYGLFRSYGNPTVPVPPVVTAEALKTPYARLILPSEQIYVDRADRHITAEQAKQINRAMSKFSASKIGLFTLSSSPERATFMAELGDAIRQTGWTVIRGTDITPGDANWMGLSIGPLKHAGVSIIVAEKLNPEPLLAAFEAAKTAHRIVDVDTIDNFRRHIYSGSIDTSMLVLFVGPNNEPKPDE